MRRRYEIKSKKTKYGVIFFESMIEARWAAFFDCLGIKYEYEPTFAEVETGCRVVNYKPDFFLKDLNKYIEIKPSKPYGIENTKAAGWAKHIGDIIVLFNLNPPTMELENGWLFFSEGQDQTPILFDAYWWWECPKCGHIDIDEYAQITSCGCYSQDFFNKIYEEEIKGIKISPSRERSARLLAAYKTAKNYNFMTASSKRASKLPVQHALFK